MEGPEQITGAVGDWVIWNESSLQWEKVIQTKFITSFNSRTGAIKPEINDYSWIQINKTISSINDLADVNIVNPQLGDLLKWNGSTWEASTDLVGLGVLTVDSSNIIDQSIVNSDISTTTQIKQTQIKDLTSDIARKLSVSGGTLTGDLNLNNNNLNIMGTINGTTISSLDTQSTNNTNSAPGLEDALATGSLFTSPNNPLSITNGANSLVGNDSTIDINLATSSQNGYLSSQDWIKFYNKINGVDDLSLELNNNTLQIKNNGISSIKMAPSIPQYIQTDYTVTSNDNKKTLFVSGATITLPLASTMPQGFEIFIKRLDINNSSAISHIIPVGSDLIDGLSRINYISNFDSKTYFSDGSKWSIKNQYTRNLPPNTTLTNTNLTCPSNFIPVPGNNDLGTDDFCVMTIEARRSFNDNISFNLTGIPWVNIPPGQALLKCRNYEENGFAGTFDLINNPEWMTIARNIELSSNNWTKGIIGVGSIGRGHSDLMPIEILNIIDINDPYNQTQNNASQAFDSGLEQKRTHNLSSGNTIWDFAGNVSEWVNWSTNATGYSIGPKDAPPNLMELGTLAGSLTSSDLQSSLGFGSFFGLGQWIGGTGGALYRGGNYAAHKQAGIFSLSLDLSASDTNNVIGFRCVYRP